MFSLAMGGGLDAIITQLLNHMDGTGPPPMAKENIADIPTVEISSAMREKNTSCSVCWKELGRVPAAPGSESASAPEPPTPHLDEASGGVPPAQEAGGAGSNSQRRASVTVSGSGGLTGLIQSALNQVFASSWTGSPGGSSSSSSSSDSSGSP